MALFGASPACSDNDSSARDTGVAALPISTVCDDLCPKLIECGEFTTISECCTEAGNEGADCLESDLPGILSCTDNEPSCSTFSDCLNSIPCLEQ